MTSSTTAETFQTRWAIGIHVILPTFSRIIDIRDQVLHNGEVAELGTPATPIANAAEAPAATSIQPLTTTPSKGVCAVWVWVDTDVQQIISEHF